VAIHRIPRSTVLLLDLLFYCCKCHMKTSVTCILCFDFLFRCPVCTHHRPNDNPCTEFVFFALDKIEGKCSNQICTKSLCFSLLTNWSGHFTTVIPNLPAGRNCFQGETVNRTYTTTPTHRHTLSTPQRVTQSENKCVRNVHN
jgi:hypothetical protein